jgi:hypothetical protein
MQCDVMSVSRGMRVDVLCSVGKLAWPLRETYDTRVHMRVVHANSTAIAISTIHLV